MTEKGRSEAAWKAIREEFEAREGNNIFAVNFAPIDTGSGEILEIIDIDQVLIDPNTKPSIRYLPYSEPASSADSE